MNGRKSRKRNFEALTSMANDVDSDEEDEDEKGLKTVSFQNGETSFIVKESAYLYTFGKTNFNEELLGSPDYWHQICHDRKFSGVNDVLPALFDTVGEAFFAPVSFRSMLRHDTFFVRKQGQALKKLFAKELRIPIKGSYVDLIVKFCVAKFQQGMLNPREKLANIILGCTKSSKPSIAHLSLISSHQELKDMKFSLNNFGSFFLLCEQVRDMRKLLQEVRTLNLSSNEISRLWPLKSVRGLHLFALDLRFNRIDSIDEFHHIKHFNIQEILLIGNPILDEPMFAEKIKEILPTLKKVDIEPRNLPNFQSPLVFDNSSEQVKNVNLNARKLRAVDVNDHFKKEFQKFNNDSWVKVVVTHAGMLSKKQIIQEMQKQFFNRIEFYPCYYNKGELSNSFLLFKNFKALTALVQNNLKMMIGATEVIFELHMNYADWIDGHANWRSKINFAIRKRLRENILDLDSFGDDEDLDEILVSMSSLEGLSSILSTVEQLNDTINTLSLRDNNINKAEGLKILRNFSNLVSLDLRGNDIESIESLPTLHNIVEVFLDRNPLCVHYSDNPWRYVHNLLRAFPSLKHIDGRQIDADSKTLTMRNFLFSPSYYTFTESFIKLFFERYDSGLKKSLEELYVNDSMFTLRLNDSNLSNCCTLHGRNSIISFFETQKPSQHDFASFSVDVVSLSFEENVLITVNGYLKEEASSFNEDERMFAFTRTFLLEQNSLNHEALPNTFFYYIKNEQLLLRYVVTGGVTRAFSQPVVTEEEIRMTCNDLRAVTSEQQEVNIAQLNNITKLDVKWCERLLQNSEWNVNLALDDFVNLVERRILTDEDFDLDT